MQVNTTASPSNSKLATIAGVSVVTFATASIVAAVGYPSWMWTFVFVGLVFSPVVLVITLGLAVRNRLSHT